jgi:ribosome assembly protein 1
VLDKTQGTVNAQLDLDTWKIIEEDPFFTPLTIEEIEENGLENNIHNQARIILEKIRQKKGLSGTEKIVVAAEKQRTLKKD